VVDDRDWRKALVPPEATLQQAIRSLNESCVQIVLVVSPDRVLLGTLTDGDIRRGLLRGLDINSPITSIIHRDPLVVTSQFGSEMVLQLMRANKVYQLPVVDAERRVTGLHLWDSLLAPENCPKPLLPVAGKPILEHIIERAKAQGFHRFLIAVHYLGRMIEEHFGDGRRWQVDISYVREASPLGTAGALSLVEPQPKASFVVCNGDVLTDIHYGELVDFHARHAAVATMAVRLHEWQHPYGVVRTKGVDIVGFEEKPISRTHVNAGIYVLEPAALQHMPRGEACDMPTLFARLQEQGARTIVYPMHEPWLDVGRPTDYAHANGLAANKE
jgi:dTDP-glucose pyrophosphorylase